jgi:hypothetical protein
LRHTLRHTAITHLAQAGVDLPTVKRISGHKTLAMVERYAHQNGAHIGAAMDKLESRLNLGSPAVSGAVTQELHRPRECITARAGISLNLLVARGRIELPTRGFSIRCSTD